MKRIYKDKKTGRFIQKKRSYDKLPKTKKFIDLFLERGSRRGGKFSRTTIDSYKSSLDLFFGFVKKDFDKVTEQDVEDFKFHLLKEGYDEVGVNTKLMSVRGLFRYAKEKKKIKSNPFKIVKNNNSKAKNKFLSLKFLIFSRDELRRLFSVIKNPRDSAMIGLFTNLGLRVSELCKLKLEDVMWSKKQMWVDGKGDKARLVDLKPKMIRRLKLWLLQRGKQPTDYLFTTKFGKKFRQGDIRDMFKKYCKMAELGKNEDKHKRKIHPYLLRHTFITHAIEDGIPLPEIAKIVGHNDINTTMRYAELAQMESSYVKKWEEF